MATQTQIRVKEIAFTSYPVQDLKRARAFYENIFGLKPEMVHEEGTVGWVEYEIKGAAFALYKYGEDNQPSAHGPSMAFEVDNIHQVMEQLQQQNVKILMPAYESPVCWIATVLDSEGNSLTIHQRK